MLKAFEDTTRYLKQKQIKARASCRKPVSRSKFEKLTSTLGVPVADSVRDFYTTVCNGCKYDWNLNDDPENTIWGYLKVPSLYTMLSNHRYFLDEEVNAFRSDRTCFDQCMGPEYRERAFTILDGMLTWAPIVEHGDGDSTVVDLVTGKVLHYYGSWYDGFPEVYARNSIPLGESIGEFIEGWSFACFTQPTTYWGASTKDSVNWQSPDFRAEFQRQA